MELQGPKQLVLIVVLTQLQMQQEISNLKRMKKKAITTKNYQLLLANIVEFMTQIVSSCAMFAKSGFVMDEAIHLVRI